MLGYLSYSGKGWDAGNIRLPKNPLLTPPKGVDMEGSRRWLRLLGVKENGSTSRSYARGKGRDEED